MNMSQPSNDPIEHFWKAARELLKAARGVLDAADGLVEDQLDKSPPSDEPRVRKFDVE
ncbi:MAG: hypothetical protein SGJ13_01560 [Actinomycetota bacterium]|nr:hypothetical protein [Actinomycetota bacterium]